MTESSSSASDERRILRRTVQLPAKAPPLADGRRSLRLCMLGCEDHPPYGPTEATGALFLDLVTSAIHSAYPVANAGLDAAEVAVDFDVFITIFTVQVMDYPAQWDEFDGILIPGSFSSAYETFPWIERLKDVIQNEIYANKRKTLAICFGHQLYAHSFNQHDGQGGLCQPCPHGHQVGRILSSLTREGSALLNQPAVASLHVSSDALESKPNAETIQLMYTHGDHVASLPPCAVSLFGNDSVPIQAAAYFANNDEAAIFCESIGSNDQKGGENLPPLPKPHAFTFQAHPEYSSQDGLAITFTNVLRALEEKRVLPQSDLAEAEADTTDKFPQLQQESIRLFVTVCNILGWF